MTLFFDGLVRANLHQRHMLMRRRVEHHVRPVDPHHAVDAAGIAHRADQREQIQLRVRPPQLLLNGIGVVLIDIENDQQLRLGARDL